jgi:MAC/Perforin domain
MNIMRNLLFLLSLFVTFCLGIQNMNMENYRKQLIIQSINDIANEIIDQFCPYNGLYGLSDICQNISDAKLFNTLPIQIGVGWDPVVGQIRLPFFDMTYLENKTFITNNNTVFNIPDQINLDVINISNAIYTNYTFETPFDLVTEMNNSRSQVISGILSQPPTQNDFLLSYFSAGKQYAIMITEYRSVYNLQNNTDMYNMSIIPLVQEAIDSLPETYDQDIYDLFIQYWGTHVVFSGQGGAFAQQLTTLKGCYAPNIPLAYQAQLTLLKNLYPVQYQHVSYYQSYQQYSSATNVNLYGGNPVLVNPYNWTERINTIQNYPVLTSVQVIPITDFIQNEIIKENLEIAINNYFSTGDDQINSTLTSWNTDWMGKQNVVAVPTLTDSYTAAEAMNENIQMEGNLTLDIAHFECAGTKDPWTECSMYELWVLSMPDSLCTRDENGLITSYIDVNYWNMVQEHESGMINFENVVNGTAKRYGCSMASVLVNFKLWSTQYYMFCCMGCTLIIESSGSDRFGAFNCECPTF